MAVDFFDFHVHTLPESALVHANALIARHTADLGSLGFRIVDTGQAFSYFPEAGRIRVSEGDAADTLIELTLEQWQGLVADLETAPALLYGNKLGAGSRGDMLQFLVWDPLLRSLYTGRPLYDEDSLQLLDCSGSPLDPERAFRLGRDGEQDMRHFLDTAGYLLLKGVFSGLEVQVFQQLADELRDTASVHDKASWWGVDARGEDVVTRVLNGGSQPLLREIASDERMQKLHALMPEGLAMRDPAAVDAITVVFKTPEMKEGLSDLPWHRDCGMGGHAVMCPVVNVSIYLSDATADAGELWFLPGSHRFCCPAPQGQAGIAAAACAGDVTLHYGDVMHQAPPPRSSIGPFRSSILLSFQPEFENHRGQRHYNDVLLDGGDGHVVTPQQQ